jgi:predicted homoserine dehydrogenase-like protein
VTTSTRVARLAAEGRTIHVGVLGAGYVGRGLVHLLERLPGFRVTLIANRSVEHARDAFLAAGVGTRSVAVIDDQDARDRALLQGQRVVVTDPGLMVSCDSLDVIVEGTGSLDYAGGVVMAALGAGRRVLSINAELDATIGWLLHAVAAANGGTYTICDGDQPGVQMRTVDLVRQMTFDVVASVTCKRHLDVHQSITQSAPYAARDGTSTAITVAAGDGTKMNVEQAVVANLTGLVPERRGMHGVPTTLENALRDVLAVFERDGVVDYTLGGDLGAGVFVVGRAPEPEAVQQALRFFKLGDGPEYLLFNPYTLVQFEMPRSIAEVVLDDAPLWSPFAHPVADVVAVAKHELRAGERVDGIGGDKCYGQIDTVDAAGPFLPIAFAHHARITTPVGLDEPIPRDAVELDAEAPIVALRRQQDALLAGAS